MPKSRRNKRTWRDPSMMRYEEMGKRLDSIKVNGQGQDSRALVSADGGAEAGDEEAADSDVEVATGTRGSLSGIACVRVEIRRIVSEGFHHAPPGLGSCTRAGNRASCRS